MGSSKVQSFYRLLRDTEVVIPMIQRDYAQGRLTEKVKSIRHDFLDALYKACKDKKPLHLDFIYGEEDVRIKSRYILILSMERKITVNSNHLMDNSG